MSSSNLLNYFKELPSSTIVTFVKQQKEMSDRMKSVYQKVKEITGAEIRRMSEEEVLNLSNTLLTKVSHVFIIDNFSGSSFDHLNSKKSATMTIFGVPLIEKMIENEANVMITKHWKIHNNTFQDLVICTSNLHTSEKKKIEDLVKLMDGKFTNELSSEVTHLITNSTKTVKYSDASSLNIPIYHTEWIFQIWNKWQKQDRIPKADSEQFDVFKLPPLFDLKIALTGMTREGRNEIIDLIEENGGKFDEIFKTNETDILVMEKLDPENSKFKVATKYKIPVLSVDWIHESIRAGYALCYKDFAFKRPKSLDSSSSSFSESVTNISLDNSDKNNENVEEKKELPKPILNDKTNEKFLLDYTIGQAKKLGHFLDGYVFYFYNFPTEHYFKAGKIISTCGGIKITELDQSVTHILCFDQENLVEFHKKTVEKDFHGSMIDFKWLIECLKQGKLLSETDYIITPNTANSNSKIIPPSPLSRKAIQSLNVSLKCSSNDDLKKEKENAKKTDFPSIASDISVSRKRSYDEGLSEMNTINKRRKTNDSDENRDKSKFL